MLILNILSIITLLEKYDLEPYDFSIDDGYAVVYDFGYHLEIEIEDSTTILITVRSESGTKQDLAFNFYEFERYIRHRLWLGILSTPKQEQVAKVIEFKKRNSL
ncbi:MAG: hypothetical protein QM538_05120 [Methylacidiphilales bacterium]|nr:hypothetical protein [Candidatus Methylacidiphilales bacterium]